MSEGFMGERPRHVGVEDDLVFPWLDLYRVEEGSQFLGEFGHFQLKRTQ